MLERIARIVKPLAPALICVALVAAAPRGGPGADVAIATSLGTIVVRLDARAAPSTTKNFLHYVDTHAYDGSSFYRTVRRSSEPQARIEVIQGGLNPQSDNPMAAKLKLEPTSATHLHNTDGTIAMARTADPNSATTEFFIDIGDDRFLDAGGPTGAGYAAFGKVIRGMEVVRKIQAAKASGESLTPPVTILKMRRV